MEQQPLDFNTDALNPTLQFDELTPLEESVKKTDSYFSNLAEGKAFLDDRIDDAASIDSSLNYLKESSSGEATLRTQEDYRRQDRELTALDDTVGKTINDAINSNAYESITNNNVISSYQSIRSRTLQYDDSSFEKNLVNKIVYSNGQADNTAEQKQQSLDETRETNFTELAKQYNISDEEAASYSDIEKNLLEMWGMKKRTDRGLIFPVPSNNKDEGWLAPSIIYDFASAIAAPYVALHGGKVTPEDATNVALNVTLGSVGQAPKNALTIGINLKNIAGRTNKPTIFEKVASLQEAEVLQSGKASVWASGETAAIDAKVADVIETSLPSTLDTQLVTPATAKPMRNIWDDTNAPQVDAATKQILQDVLQNVPVVPQFSVEELPTVATNAVKEFVSNLDLVKAKPYVADVRYVENTGYDVAKTELVIGNENKGFFEFEQQAKDLADAYGLDPARYRIEEVPASANRFQIVYNQDIKYFESLSPMDTQKLGFFDKYLNPKRTLDRRNVAQIQAAGEAAHTIMKNVYEKAAKPIMQLGNKEKLELDDVLHEMRIAPNDADATRNGKWFTKKEFRASYNEKFGRDPTNKDYAAYNAVRDVHEKEWVMKNNARYLELKRHGYNTIEFNVAGGKTPIKATGKVYDSFGYAEDFDKVVAFDAEEGVGVPLNVAYKNIHELNRAIKSGDVSFVKFSDTQYVFPNDSNGFKHALVKNPKQGALEFTQMGKTEGPHIMYKEPWYVKGAQVFSSGKDGRFLTRGNDFVYGAANTRQEAEKFAFSFNMVQKSYNLFKEGKLDRLAFEQVLTKHAPFGLKDATKFEEYVNTHNVPMKGKAKVTFDREVYEPDKGSDAFKASYSMIGLGDDVLSVLQPGLEKPRTGFNAKRGNRLLYTPDGSIARMATPLETMVQGATKASRFAAYNSAIDANINRWYKAAEQHLRASEVAGLNPQEIYNKAMNNPQMFNNPKSPMTRKLLDAHNAIDNMLSIPTKEDSLVESAWRAASELIDNRGGQKLQSTAKLMYNLRDSNPVNALKSFMFYANIGFCKLANIPMNLQTTISALAMHPVHGVRALGRMLPTSFAILNGKDSVIESLATKLAGEKDMNGGFLFKNKEEAVKFFKGIRDSNLTVSGQESFANLASTSSLSRKLVPMKSNVAGKVSGAVGATLRVGSVPFFATESANRIIGYSIAWDKVAKELPQLEKGSPTFMAKVFEETHRLTMDMDTLSKGYVEKDPLLGTATQYMTYPMHFISAMAPKVLGGNGRFTTAEKAALIGSTAALYGLDAIPGGEQVEDTLTKNGIIDTNQMEQINRGIINRTAQFVTGAKVDLESNAQVGTFLSELYRSLTTDSVVELTGNALYSTSKNMLGAADSMLASVWSLKNFDEGVTVSAVASDIATTAVKSFSGTRTIAKGVGAYENGYFVDNLGKPVAPATKTAAILYSLGFGNEDLSRVTLYTSKGYLTDKEMSETKKQVAKDYVSCYNYIVSGDKDKAILYNAKFREELKSLPILERNEVAEYAARLALAPSKGLKQATEWKAHVDTNKMYTDLIGRAQELQSSQGLELNDAMQQAMDEKLLSIPQSNTVEGLNIE